MGQVTLTWADMDRWLAPVTAHSANIWRPLVNDASRLTWPILPSQMFAETAASQRPRSVHVTHFAECSTFVECRRHVGQVYLSWHSECPDVLPSVTERLFTWHSANSLFAECPIYCTRQWAGHSATTCFPYLVSLNISTGVFLLFPNSFQLIPDIGAE